MDSEVSNNAAPDDFNGFIWDAIGAFPFFLMLMAVSLYIMTSTQVYNDALLRVNSALIDTQTGDKTDKGIVVTSVAFGFLLSMLHILNSNDFI